MQTSRKDSFTIQAIQITDALLVWFAFYLASLLRGPIRDLASMSSANDESLTAMSWVLYIAVPFTPLVLERFGFYSRMRNKPARSVAWELIQGITTISLTIAVFAVFAQIEGTRRLILGIGAILIFLILFARVRITSLILANRKRKGLGGERVIVAGSEFEIKEMLGDLDAEAISDWEIVDRFDLTKRTSEELLEVLNKESVGRVIFRHQGD